MTGAIRVWRRVMVAGLTAGRVDMPKSDHERVGWCPDRGVRATASLGWSGLIVIAVLLVSVSACTSDEGRLADGGDGASAEEPKRAPIRFEDPMDVFDVLEGFLINVPRAVRSVWLDETSIRMAVAHDFDGITDEQRLSYWFTNAVLWEAERIYRDLPEFAGSQELYTAYVEGFARCLEDSPYPDITWFGFSADDAISQVDTIPPTEFIVIEGLELIEFRETQARCAQYAAMYPALDPAHRDTLLRPQREHFVRELRKYLLSNPQSVAPIEDAATDYGIFGGWIILPDGGNYSVETVIY